MAESIGFSALAFALAALGTDGSGGGGEGGTVSVRINQVYTIEPDEQARVVNIGDQQTVILDMYIPRGYQGEQGAPGQAGQNGSKWYVSTETPGTNVEGMADGDFVLYSTNGSVYQMVDGSLQNSNINLAGSQWILIDTEPSADIPEGSKPGDIVVFNDGSCYTVAEDRLVATGINLTGPSGYSPSIEVKEDTEDTYILTITNEDGSFDTPNLKATSSSTLFDIYGYAQSIGYEGTEDEFKQAFLSALNFFTKKDTIVDGNADPTKDPTLDGGDSDEEVGIDTGDATLTFDNRLEDSTPGV